MVTRARHSGGCQAKSPGSSPRSQITMSRMAAPVSLDVHGRQVIVTHPGRVVFP
ncbi:hypothetical protein GR255_21825, partial [Mycobacterium tuberculosis]|nr:hypothetical protein [Mycobacterium tuberculosis]